MEVQMEHSLTGIGSAVGDHTVAAFQIFCLSDLGNHLKNVSNHSTVFRSDAVAAVNVCLGHHQNVGRCLGRDVPEGIDQFVLLNLGGGNHASDDLAEQTVFHNNYLQIKVR